ncbi:MAG: N-acetylmuramoyl-L-alanine amidase [Clostridia bacterium]|nr:N-acetylmuramoyl-L-alanine amidase [Clostridia bacterium]
MLLIIFLCSLTPLSTSQAAMKLELTPYERGFSYAYSLPGEDFSILWYSTPSETGRLVLCNEEGQYSGDVSLPLSGVIVCIDPGHQEFGKAVRTPAGPGLTGYIKGTSGMAQGVVTLRKEFIVTMEAAVKLRDELLRQGATVFLTREEPYTFLSNLDRSLIAEEGGAHIMLRLHCDLRENRKTQGISVYVPRNSDYARAVADPDTYRHMGELLINAMKNRLGYELTEATGRVRINDQFVGNNWAKMICFLVEMGFMSNPEEDIKLATPEYQQWLAEGMAQGVYEIALFRGLVQPENSEQ